MVDLSKLNSMSDIQDGHKLDNPCTIVIFGASGDLTIRKLIPALYHLYTDGQMPSSFRVVGFARREKTDESWRDEMRVGIEKYSRTRRVDANKWQAFSGNLYYHRGDLTDFGAYGGLAKRLAASDHAAQFGNLVFYLAVSPSLYGEVVDQLQAAGLLKRYEQNDVNWQRVVVEKPFGRDLQSAQLLNNQLIKHALERQIFRIDHYLGKETVQNIMMFRFSNAIFEQLWSREAIEHVQITVSEDIGVGSRGGYFEEAGTLRDMMQNHLLQILSLVAMEPPPVLEAEDIRNEKVKLLKSIRKMTPEAVAKHVVRGQYFAGTVNGENREGYRQEERVNSKSNVETFVAVKLFIDNWRWSGVPFYLRTGKNLPYSASEVRVQFRPTPNVLFAAQDDLDLQANALTLRLQPDERISLRFNGKVPGNSIETRPVRMHFGYDAEFGAYTPEAYERLLLEAMAGDATLFIRRDEVETAWQIVDDIRAGWGETPLSNHEFYAAGTWGPVAAEDLLAADNHLWHIPAPAK
ncbi:MAG: glucose-6-phosphate dehydrogenase [Verrucomicrobiales bacterium]|nr:glucose-6-phosphate dehydrogenase [Verrucomicrobiales bacterium]